MPSAARKRAFWARWSCCSKKESAPEAGKSFASFFKSCGVWSSAPRPCPWGVSSAKSQERKPHAPQRGDRLALRVAAHVKHLLRQGPLFSRRFLQTPKRTSKLFPWMSFFCLMRKVRGLAYLLRSVRPGRWFFLTGCAGFKAEAFLKKSFTKKLPPPPARFFITCTAYTPSRRGPATWRPAFPPRTPGPGVSTAPGRCKRPPAPAPPSRRKSPSPRQTG